MTSRYKPHGPEHYPPLWLTQTRRAAATPEKLFDVEITQTARQAETKMERLRAFAKGLEAYPGACPPEIAELLQAGYTLRFKRLERPGPHWRFVVYLYFDRSRWKFVELPQNPPAGG